MKIRTLLALSIAAAMFAVPDAMAQRGRKLGVGDRAPDLASLSSSVSWVKNDFSPVDGGTVVVEFWATWCGPCRLSIPHLTELQERYGVDGLQIVGLSQEEEPVVKAFVNAQGSRMDYSVGVTGGRGGADRAWMGAAGRKTIPTAFIVDAKGVIQYIGSPLSDEFEEVLPLVVAGRYDAVKMMQASPMLEGARKNASLRNWTQSDDYYGDAVNLDKKVFAEVYLEWFKTRLLKRGDKQAAYDWARGVIKDRASEDPELAVWFAQLVAIDPEIPEDRRDLDFALFAAKEGAKHASRDDDPTYSASQALVHYHRGELNEAIALQRQAYFDAMAHEKPTHEQILINYRDKQQKLQQSG